MTTAQLLAHATDVEKRLDFSTTAEMYYIVDFFMDQTIEKQNEQIQKHQSCVNNCNFQFPELLFAC